MGEAAKVVRGGCRRGEMNEVIALYSIASTAEDGGEMAAMDVEYKTEHDTGNHSRARRIFL